MRTPGCREDPQSHSQCQDEGTNHFFWSKFWHTFVLLEFDCFTPVTSIQGTNNHLSPGSGRAENPPSPSMLNPVSEVETVAAFLSNFLKLSWELLVTLLFVNSGFTNTRASIPAINHFIYVLQLSWLKKFMLIRTIAKHSLEAHVFSLPTH